MNVHVHVPLLIRMRVVVSTKLGDMLLLDPVMGNLIYV